MKRIIALLLALTLIGGVVRLFYLDSRSFDGDEGAVLVVANQDSLEEIMRASSLDVHPPLLAILTHLIIGDSKDFTPTMARLVSLLAGVLLIPATWLFARRLVSEQTALIASGLVAISGFLLPYSQELRMYPLLGLLFILNFWAFIASENIRKPSATLFWLVLGALMVWTHYLGIIVLGCEFAYLFWRAYRLYPGSRSRSRDLLLRLGASLVIVFVLLLPIIPLAKGQFAGRIAEQATGKTSLSDSLVGVGNFIFRIGFGRLILGIDPSFGYLKQLIKEHWNQALLLVTGGLFYFLLLAGGIVKSLTRVSRAWRINYFLLLVMFVFAFSFAEIGDRAVRNLSFLFPIFALFLALGIEQFFYKGLMGKVIVGGFIILQVLSVISWYQQARQPGTKEIARFLSKNATASEIVLSRGSFGKGDSFILNYYFRRLGVTNPPATESFFGEYRPGNLKRLRAVSVQEKINNLLKRSNTVWFYDFTYESPDKDKQLEGSVFKLGKDKEGKMIEIFRISKASAL